MNAMTDAEHDLVDRMGAWFNDFKKVSGVGNPDAHAVALNGDLAEAVHHVHALQNMVLAQAAARVYPQRYRLLGGLPRT